MHACRQAGRQQAAAGRQEGSQAGRPASSRQAGMHAGRQAGRQAAGSSRQAGRQSGRQTRKQQASRQASRQAGNHAGQFFVGAQQRGWSIGQVKRRQDSSAISSTKQTKTLAFVKKARLARILRQKGSPSRFTLAMQTCAKCSRESDKVVFKNKNKVMKDSKVKPIYWCSECIALANQLTCIFKEAPELRSAYATIDKDSLMQEYKEKNREAIKAKLVQVLESKTSVSQETTFKGMGEWLDEYDIMEKYKSKPWQAQNIIETARQFKHPTRGCVLYEDLNYDSTELSQATQDLVDHMKLETNNTERLSKKKQS